MLPTFKLQSLGAAQTNVPFTLGHVFAPGGMAAGRGLIARAADGSYLPLQVDQKATHADGSVRHAILSGIVPALAAGEKQSFQLLDADKRTSKQTFIGVPASVQLTLAGVVYTATIDPAAAFALWLTGPIVNEHQFVVPFTAAGAAHPHLVARFAVRDYGRAQRVDITIENNWAYVPGPQNFAFDAEITVDGRSVYKKTITQLRQARWRKVFWSGTAPQVNAEMDMAYLRASRAVPNYDMAFPPAESFLQGVDARIIGAFEPMALGLASSYMPMTGANGEIGILPEWQAAYVMSGDRRARAATLGTGDAAGSYGIHYRDKDTDLPVSLKNYPYMTLDGNPGDTWNAAKKRSEAFPSVAAGNDSPYTGDSAHCPSLAYLPYLVAGDYYYLEEMQFWAMWVMFKQNPNYRGKEQGLIVNDQLRGQAWSLRTLAQAAAFTPDAHPLKADLLYFMDNNLDFYGDTYVGKPGLPVMTHGYSMSSSIAIKPWMDDFYVSAIGHAADLGFAKAIPILKWKAQFTVGTMVDPGVCWSLGARYEITVVDPAKNDPQLSTQQRLFDTIAKCYVHDYPAIMLLPCAGPEMGDSQGAKVDDMGGISDGNQGYPSYKQPALAYAVDTGLPGAQRAWDLFMSRSVKPDYSTGEQFNIAPRNYTAAYVAPYIDPDSLLDWQQIATEGQTVTVPTATTVRFGANGRFIKKVVGGAVPATSAEFGGDPAPNVVKVLQQLIPSTEGNPMTHKLSVTSIAFANQDLAYGTEAATSLLVELLGPDGAVLGSTATVPGDITGIVFADLAAKHTLRASGLNGAGVMGTPALKDFVPADYLPVVVPPADPLPTTAAYSLPSAITFTLVAE